MSKTESRRNCISRKARRLLVLYLYVLTSRLIRIIPRSTAYALMNFLSRLAYLVVRRQRRLVLRNLKTAFPHLSDAERGYVARRMYENLSRNAVEFVRFPKLRQSGGFRDLVEVIGRTHLDEAYSEGNGVLLLTAHLGNWELLAAGIVNMGYKLTVLARRPSYSRYDDFLDGLRKSSGVDAVDRDNIREILRRLKQGHLIGIVSDQDIRKLDGVYVSFLGKLAYTPTGIVVLAMKTGAPIVPVFILRQRDGRHKIVFEPPIEMTRTGNKEWDILINAICYTGIIERYVRENPEQWMWFHNRWRQQPQDLFLKGVESERLRRR